MRCFLILSLAFAAAAAATIGDRDDSAGIGVPEAANVILNSSDLIENPATIVAENELVADISAAPAAPSVAPTEVPIAATTAVQTAAPTTPQPVVTSEPIPIIIQYSPVNARTPPPIFVRSEPTSISSVVEAEVIPEAIQTAAPNVVPITPESISDTSAVAIIAENNPIYVPQPPPIFVKPNSIFAPAPLSIVVPEAIPEAVQTVAPTTPQPVPTVAPVTVENIPINVPQQLQVFARPESNIAVVEPEVIPEVIQAAAPTTLQSFPIPTVAPVAEENIPVNVQEQSLLFVRPEPIIAVQPEVIPEVIQAAAPTTQSPAVVPEVIPEVAQTAAPTVAETPDQPAPAYTAEPAPIFVQSAPVEPKPQSVVFIQSKPIFPPAPQPTPASTAAPALVFVQKAPVTVQKPTPIFIRPKPETPFSLPVGSKIITDSYRGQEGIVRQEFETYPGRYQYLYETANGIQAEEIGQLERIDEEHDGMRVRGFFSYFGPDGVNYRVDYVADENGFHPTGAHLPVA